MIIRYSWPSAYEKPLSLMLEGVERLFQVFVVEFEVGEFELERVVLCFKAIGTRHHSVVFRPRDDIVVAGYEGQREESE